MIRRLQLALVWLAVIAAWEGSYRLIGWKSWQFPAPSHVVDATTAMLGFETHFGKPISEYWPWRTADEPQSANYRVLLPQAICVSGIRLLTGFFISLILGVGLGLITWRFRFLDQLLGPLFLGIQTLPSVCWVPLAILVLGLKESSIVFVLVLGSVFAVALAMRDGLRMIPPIYPRAGLMLGARRWRLYRYVLLPASLPALSSSLRQGFAFAWRSLMGAELIFAVERHGLGFLLSVGRDFADVAQVVSVIGIMIALAMLADRWIFARLEQSVRRRFGLIATA